MSMADILLKQQWLVNMLCLRKWVTKTSHPSRDWRVGRPGLDSPQRGPFFKPTPNSFGALSNILPHSAVLWDASVTPVVSVTNEEERQHAFPVAALKNFTEIFHLKQNLTTGTQYPLFTFLALLPSKVGFNTSSSRKMCKIEHRDIQYVLLTL